MKFAVTKDEALLNVVRHYYNEPHRHYHTIQHIADGFELAEELSLVTPEFELDLEQQLAWLFHDIVYCPGNADNERNSIKLMNHLLKDFQYPNLKYAEHIIMCTKFHVATSPVAAPIVDLDMSCFAFLDKLRTANVQIMKEFHLSDAEGRIQFLLQLDKTQIYQTEWCKTNWEDVAHRNIKQSIIELEYV